MIKQYFKQAIQMLKENPLVNSISILGTALSIAMIMVLLLVFQINTAGYAPESNRNRMLFLLGARAEFIGKGVSGNSNLSQQVVKECVYSLDMPEAVTAYFPIDRPVWLPGKRSFREYRIKYTDPGFWKVFDFAFTEGKPFTEADFESGIPQAIITTRTASNLFGRQDVLGETIIIDYINYTVTAIVKPVSKAAGDAYAEIWLPYTSNDLLMQNRNNEGISGAFQCAILAGNSDEFDLIREEIDEKVKRYNEGKSYYQLSFVHNPLTRFERSIGSNFFYKVEIKDYLLDTGLLLLFLLLIPALNLTGVVQSSIQKRRSEIGLRKAFGATRGTLMQQVLYENLVVTCIGGLIGLALSFIFLYVCKAFLFNVNIEITADMLFKPGLFVVALLFAFILNLLSAGIPAYQISRQHIVDALRESNT